LIGNPVDHSLSPFIMNRACAVHDLEALYVVTRVTKEEAGGAIRSLRAQGFAGLNVTYPLKEAVLSLADRTTPAVDVIQAANTLLLNRQGITADNTDSTGTADAIDTLAATSPRGKRVFVFGAGGAGRAAAYGLLSAGAATVTFGVRDAEKSTDIVDRFRRAFPESRVGSYDTRGRAIDDKKVFDDVDVIVNATPVGMAGYDSSVWITDEAMIRSDHLCFDFVYHPRDTRFIKAARQRGATVLDGLALLVAQARAGFNLWTGRDFSLTEMMSAVESHLASDEIKSP
jgi:shikimate dehydrogenase